MERYCDVFWRSRDIAALEEPCPSELRQEYAPALYLEPLGGAKRFRAAVLLAIRDAFDKTSPKKFPVFKKISRPEGRSFTAHTDKNRYFIKSFFFVK